jgi:hypothetical protein
VSGAESSFNKLFACPEHIDGLLELLEFLMIYSLSVERHDFQIDLAVILFLITRNLHLV